MTNLKVEEVMSEARVAVLLKRAARLRAQAKTLCNERSSRSHSVFILKIEGTNTETGEVCCGALNMVSGGVFDGKFKNLFELVLP